MLAYIFPELNIILCLVLIIGVVSYNISFDIMQWGLRPCMEMETNANETIVNYGDVGFGLIMDTRMAPLMRLRV